jgi:pyruvate formate-lyase/glycerol dehydratase family glycyl radical enzyme
MSERIDRLRNQALTTYVDWSHPAPAGWDTFLAGLAGEPAMIRSAKEFAWSCAHRDISIRDGELLVGTRPELRFGATATKPFSWGRQGFDVPQWFPLPKEFEEDFKQGLVSLAGNHMTMDYAGVIRSGLEGRIQRAEAKKKQLLRDQPGAERELQFLDALIIVARGYIHLCSRHAGLAEELAGKTSDEVRREELKRIAEHCRQVPARPPRSFWEACQCLWFCFQLVPDAPGRVDQYLFPFYQHDLEKGLITRESARELLSCLWLRYFEHAGASQPVGAVHHLTLGGVGPDGADASNAVTWLCLDVTEELRLQRPQVGLRWNRGTPDDLLKRAVCALRGHGGSPDLCNDEQIVPALVRTGIALEDARDFSLSGCNEIIITGKAQMGSVEGFVNMPKILRTVLGLEPALGPGVALDRLNSFEDLLAACESEMGRVAAAVHQISVARDRHGAENADLVCSLVVDDCIENARGYNQGGARYNHCNWDVIGIANLADSLAAIRKLIFEDHVCTLVGLVGMLRSDWEGAAPMRRRILNECPHFGNDDDRVDHLAGWCIERFAALMNPYKPFRGGEYILGTLAGAENMHIEFGRVTGATPDGRKAGEPVADSIGAAQGRDRAGVTALLNSVAKLPHRLLPTAVSLNVRLAPKLIETEEGAAKVAALIRAHFLSGGQHMQINLVSREMLLEAQREPELHADIMVRVAGYSAPFVSLWKDLQDEIISRTEHAA